MFLSIMVAVLSGLIMQSTTNIEQVAVSDQYADSQDSKAGNDVYLERNPKSPDHNLGDDQVSSAKEPATELSQLNKGKEDGPIDQLSQVDRNTESTPALSERRQSRNTKTDAVGGADRCSAELLSAIDRDYCQHVIENRSADFTGPGPTKLSPEQKLLGERNFEFVSNGPEEAVRRLASGNDSAEDRDNQAVASLVLGQASATETQPADNEDPADVGLETQSLIEAIVNSLAGPQGP